MQESQDIPEITVTDENATTTQLSSQPDIEKQLEVEESEYFPPQSVENIFEMESQVRSLNDFLTHGLANQNLWYFQVFKITECQ